MSNITISVVDPEVTNKVTMEVANDVPVRDITEMMAKLMELPAQGEYEGSSRYSLNRLDLAGRFERL